MLSQEYIEFINSLLNNSFNQIKIEDDPINIYVRRLYQYMHAYRVATAEDEEDFENESLLFRDRNLKTCRKVYVAPVWSLFNMNSIIKFKEFIVEEVNTKKLILDNYAILLPNLETKVFSPKDSIILDNNKLKNIDKKTDKVIMEMLKTIKPFLV